MPSTTGMKGGGYYDQHSGVQLSAIRLLQDWVDEAVAEMPLPDQAVTVVDLGSSQGRNAIHVMASVVAGLRRRTDRPLRTVYSDLPSNDFNRLFANLERARLDGLFPADVYPEVLGGSFYGPLLPPGTVHLATCFNAVHWLDRPSAVALTDFVAYRRPIPADPGPAPSLPDVAASFKRQAEQDLVGFLECRAAELAPGAKLLIASPGDTDDFRFGDALYEVLDGACLDLVAEGRLMRGEYDRLTMPCYYRTVAEMVAPVKEHAALRDAFTVDRAEALEGPVPFVAQFRRDGDAAAYAGAYTGFLRAVSESVVRAALDEPEDAETMERVYDRVHERLLADPERYAWRYVLSAVQLSRR